MKPLLLSENVNLNMTKMKETVSIRHNVDYNFMKDVSTRDIIYLCDIIRLATLHTILIIFVLYFF